MKTTKLAVHFLAYAVLAVYAFALTAERTSEDAASVLSQADNLGSRSGYFGVDWNDPRQVMEGIGGSITWYGAWAMAHPNKNAIMDAVFTELRPSVVRIRNTFGQGSDDGGDGGQTSDQLMKETAQIIEEGRKRLGGHEEFKILMCSWSPPVALKMSGKLNSAGSTAGEADTLKKNDRGEFIYREFAQYWLNSLRKYKELGVEPNWISIQNEPEWATPPAENFFYPGYYKAFDEVYETLKKGLDDIPLMVAPEASGFDNFVTAPLNFKRSGYLASPYSGSQRIHAIANHLYDAGVQYSDKGFYKKLDETLKNVRRQADESMTRRIFMTEFANLANHEYTDPMDLAKTIYKTLTIADSAMYLQWDLLWGRSEEGTMVIVDSPYDGIDTSKGWGFELTQSFHWFKMFCRYIRPGMQRISVKDKTKGLNGVLPLVFLSKVHDGSSTVILINTKKEWTRVQCGYLPQAVEGKPRKVYYATLDEHFTYAGNFPEESTKIWLKPNSITTLHSGDN